MTSTQNKHEYKYTDLIIPNVYINLQVDKYPKFE